MPKFSCNDLHVAYNTYQTLDFKMIEIQIHILHDHIKTDSVIFRGNTHYVAQKLY